MQCEDFSEHPRKQQEPIVRNGGQLVRLLGDPESEMFRQVQINYNLIEVAKGWCFALDERKFVQNAIEEVGRVSPRAFIRYDPEKTPERAISRKYLRTALVRPSCGTSVNTMCAFLITEGNNTRKKFPA